MRRIIVLIFSVLTVCLLSAQTPAFPGAEGGGMYTTGGRGGKVIYVTSLADDNSEGTLRWAIDQKGTRTILFAQSGIIRLSRTLSIKNGDLTIAGQSAPGDGICIAGYDVQISTDNVIIRYLRFRLGDLEPNVEADACGARNRTNIIIDHCSFSWSIDECASFYSNKDFSFQWNIVSESLNNSKHRKGTHGYGGIWGGNNASFHHNLIAHHSSRNPRFNGYKRAGLKYGNSQDDERVDFRNNVIYNWGGHSSYGGESGKYNIVANYFKYGPATGARTKNRITQIDMDENPSMCPPGFGKYYIHHNYVWGFPDVTANNWEGVSIDKSIPSEECKADVPFHCTNIAEQSAEDAYVAVLQHAGASFRRDAIDSRIVNEVKTGTATYAGKSINRPGLIDSQSDVGGWPAYNSVPAQTDSNGDGIPDGWLQARYNGKKSTDINKEGYTYLEVYLNELVNQKALIQQ